jgi:hypothetical protein
MGKQAKICVVILFAAHSTSYFLNLAREQKSLATPVFDSTFSHIFITKSIYLRSKIIDHNHYFKTP